MIDQGAFGVDWTVLPVQGGEMKKLNTFQFYSLATKIHPLTLLKGADTEFTKIFLEAFNATTALRPYIGDKGIFPPSSRHAAIELVRMLDSIGVAEFLKNPSTFDAKKIVSSWQINTVVASTP
jgi:hypothetical protein